jgi:tryptophan 2,3-dioxygenase
MTTRPGDAELTYATYLRLHQLLELQRPLSEPEEHDELLFIVIHQVYELWFKLLLHELDKIARDFAASDLFGAIATFKRARTVMKTLVGQLDILETMTPMSFAGFRSRLDTASGFQSIQFRELEFLLGLKRADLLRAFPPGTPGYADLERRLHAPSLIDRFYGFLEHRGVAIPAELRARDVTLPAVPSEAVQEGLCRLYREQPDAAILLELMTDFDEGLQEWRYRHVKLTERTIGNKPGTGGSSGVEFLKRTLFKPLFEDLWAIRHRF